MITHRNFQQESCFNEMDKYFIGLTSNFYPDWDFITDCMQQEGYQVTQQQCENRWSQLGCPRPSTPIPSDENDEFDSTKDDKDYYANIRKGLGLYFTVTTKRTVFFRSCKNKDSSCKPQNCYTTNQGHYHLCPTAEFACKCGALCSAGDFDIDHIKSFKRHWDSLKSVNVENLKTWYNSVDNLQILCIHCNRSKGAN